MFNPWKKVSKGVKLFAIKLAENCRISYKLITVVKRKTDSIKTCLL